MRISWTLIATTMLAANVAIADTFELRSGGSVSGTLLNPAEEPRTSYVVRLDSGGDVTLDARDVARSTSPPESQRNYRQVLKKMPADTAINHWEMAEWCRQQKLLRERNFHLHRVIELDANHAEARRALGYKQQEDGNWATVDEIWQDAGYVEFKGDWETPQTVRIEEQHERYTVAMLDWQEKIRRWRGWLGGKRHQDAVQAFLSIDDPLAAEPLAKLFWAETDPLLQEQFAELLGRLDSPIATAALARGAMEAGNSELRLHCLKQLEDNNRSGAASAFASELRAKDNARVRRAATALTKLGDESVILPLIRSLRTQHKYKINGNPNAMNAAFNRDPSGSGGLGGLSMGGNKTKIVNKTHENKEVLNALVKLTDQDFDFDQQAWMRWYLARTTPPQVDLRRDP